MSSDTLAPEKHYRQVAEFAISTTVGNFMSDPDQRVEGDMVSLPEIEADQVPFSVEVEVWWKLRYQWQTDDWRPLNTGNRHLASANPGNLVAVLQQDMQTIEWKARDALGMLAQQNDTPLLHRSEQSRWLPGTTCRRRAEANCRKCTGGIVATAPRGRLRCQHCHGSGKTRAYGGGNANQIIACLHCSGMGHVRCGSCNGKAVVERIVAGQWIADTQAKVTWSAKGRPRQLARFFDALDVSDFRRYFPTAKVVSAPDASNHSQIRYRASSSAIFGNYRMGDESYGFAFAENSDQWFLRPQFLHLYAIPVIEEVEATLKQRGTPAIEALAERWPVVKYVLSGKASTGGSTQTILLEECDGLLKKNYAQRLATALEKLHHRATPRMNWLYWTIVICGAVFPGWLFGPFFWEKAPVAGLVISGVSLGGVFTLGQIWTRRRQSRVRENLRLRPINDVMTLITGCTLALAVTAAIHSDKPSPLRESTIQTVTDALETEMPGWLTSGDARSTPELSLAQAQRVLARLGYYDGAIDGVMGPNTRSAIRRFENARDLSIDGALSNDDHSALLRAWRVSEVEIALRDDGYPIEEVDGRAGADLQKYIAEHLERPRRSADAAVDADTVRTVGGRAEPQA